MNGNTEVANKETRSDAAVSGLLAGILAGVVMVAFLAAAGFAGGSSVADVLARFGAGEGAMPVAGLLTHLAVSGIYGLVWGILIHIMRRFLPAPAWLLGLAYGLLLYLVAQGLLLTAPTPLAGIPPMQFLIAHGVYGLTLGLAKQRGG
ncbi:hypothetical protein FKZ61_000795 [Litorilinea aerophila]|nr:DUF6789 family protein [Litorilinea aerophila]MCC9074652.1 hypothetical protein [Litorilinea aerophila]